MATKIDPLNATLPPGRHGLPKDFVAENQRTRLEGSFGHVVREKGYCAVSIGDVCKHARVSRRTFYEHFNSKQQLADRLIVKALAKSWGLDRGIGIWTIETLMRAEVDPDTGRRSCDLLEELIARVGDIEDRVESPPAPWLPSPPAGERPRLPLSYVAAAQRDRIIAATARCIVLRCYSCARVSDIVSAAGIARNTFYECFPSKEEAARAMVGSVSEEFADWLEGLKFDIGMGAVAVELIAWRIVDKDEAHAVTQAEEALRLVRFQVEDA